MSHLFDLIYTCRYCGTGYEGNEPDTSMCGICGEERCENCDTILSCEKCGVQMCECCQFGADEVLCEVCYCKDEED